MLRYFRKTDALELDTKIKLAGDKKGFSGLNSILAEEEIEMSEDIDTDETSEVNRNLLDNITKIVQKER